MLNASSKPLELSISLIFRGKFLTLPPKLFRSISQYCKQIKNTPPYPPTVANDEIEFFNIVVERCLSIQQCRQVHAQLLVTNAHRSAFLAARLIAVYARFGFVVDAQKVFDVIPIEALENMLLWNSILRANVSHEFYEFAVRIYVKLLRLGFWPDGFTFPLVVRACANMGSSILCKVVHCHVLQMGFRNHLHVVNELLGMYGKLGRMEDACQLFNMMVVRSHVSWNTVISGYALKKDSVGASKIFKRMELKGLQPNSVTWTSLLSSQARCGLLEETMELFTTMRIRGVEISAEALAVALSVCADMPAVERGKVIHGYVIKGGYEDYLFVKNSLIGTYGKHGILEDAQKIFAHMKRKTLVSWNALISSYAEAGLCDEAFAVFSQMDKSSGHPPVTPNVISWSAVIGGFASKVRNEESLELFRQMQLAKVMPNCVTIACLLSVCAELAALNLGREIHGHVVRALVDDNILVGNGLINMYMKCGSFKEGNVVFNNITGRDIISWNSVIGGYGMHGLGENAIGTFVEMINSGVRPDSVTFVAVLSSCSHAGLVAEGCKLFDQMVIEFRIEPDVEHYACMVDLLGRAGLLQEASDIVRSMPVEPNECVWGALLNSCRMYKDSDIAEEIALEILHQKSEITGSYMLLSNIYAASGRWEDSARVRISAKTKGLKKIPGQSWIEVKKKAYTFSAGNVFQSGLDEVYRILEELGLHMETQCILNQEWINEEKSDIGSQMECINEINH